MNVVYEDLHIIVIEKPSGLATHAGVGHKERNVISLMVERGHEKVAPCHRLDKDTSGLLVLGRSPEVCAAFQEQLKAGGVQKTYLALTQGVMHRKGRIKTPLIDRQGGRRGKKVEADTRYRRLRYSRAVTLAAVKPITGRPHQIRRHLKAISHPVAGDERWGHLGFNRWIKGATKLERLFLHASRLEFKHPTSGEPLILQSPLPLELKRVLEILELPELGEPWV